VRTPGSVAPRELAITALTGLVSTPLRGGFYQFTDERHGFVFQLGPDASEPDSAGAPLRFAADLGSQCAVQRQPPAHAGVWMF
jgi:hypothetical protein